MTSYHERVRADIGRWAKAGLIDTRTASALVRDVDARAAKLPGFGRVFAFMAALLFGAAVLLFVASNWEEIPRLLRAVLLVSLIFAAYIGGAGLKLRGHQVWGEALWVVGAASFGGAISLVGQMYHLSGDEAAAVLVWCAGVAFGAAVLKSGPQAMAAAALGGVWMAMEAVISDFGPIWVVAVVAGLWLTSVRAGSSGARHLLVLAVVIHGVVSAAQGDTTEITIAMTALSAAAFAFSWKMPAEAERLFMLNGRLPLHALVGFMAGLFVLQVESSFFNEGGWTFAAAAGMGFAGTTAALVLAGRDNRALRWIAYAAFAAQAVVAYLVMVGTMLGTAGFFLAVSLALGALAVLVMRLEARAQRATDGGAA